MTRHQKTKGSVLILVIWSLGLLSVFALHLGMSIRQKTKVLSRLEQRERLRSISAGGVKIARAAFYHDYKFMGADRHSRLRMMRRNNPEEFQDIKLGRGSCDVRYAHDAGGAEDPLTRYGMTDEEGRININTADVQVLKRLFRLVLKCEDDKAADLARAVADWRQHGETEIEGFYSDDHYDNLEYPYPEKNAPFEVLDELLLVRGFTREIFDKIFDFITVYGEGKVNINSASVTVLKALGIPQDYLGVILSLRRGPDSQDDTRDDFLFPDADHMSGYLDNYSELTPEQIAEINQLSPAWNLGAESRFFRIQSAGRLDHSSEERQILCIFQTDKGKIVYWRET